MRLAQAGPIVLSCFALGGCAATTPTTQALLGSDDLKQIVIAGRTRAFKDPDSIRDARISRPFACHGGLAHVAAPPNVCVCVEANAKNSFGGYTGIQRNTWMFADRTVVDVLPPRYQDQCDPMLPFPELNGGQAPSPASPRR